MRCSTCASTAASTAAPWLFARQPETVFGTPDTLVERGAAATLEIAGAIGEDIIRACKGKSTKAALKAAINAAGRRAPKRKLATTIGRELFTGSMLGALDAAWEADADEAIAVERFSRVKIDTKFADKGMEDAVRAFLQREPVTREVFDGMRAAAQHRAVTVANAATASIVETVQRELARQVAKGADLADFGKAAAERLEAAGWTPERPGHLETVFRTNVLSSYGGGRARQMTQPKVLERRPFWQVLGVRDDRQRPNHARMMGVVLSADDPFWQEAYPPFGYACRCRCRSLNIVDGAPRVQEGKGFLRYVPDPGFTSGLDQALSA